MLPLLPTSRYKGYSHELPPDNAINQQGTTAGTERQYRSERKPGSTEQGALASDAGNITSSSLYQAGLTGHREDMQEGKQEAQQVPSAPCLATKGELKRSRECEAVALQPMELGFIHSRLP
eukprot:1153379-Pelagomonas_calceolata.AAC.10